MDNEIRRLYDRLRLYFLMREQPHWSPESYAEVLERSAKWARKWQQRFAEDESGTLAMFVSASRAPQTRPNQTPDAVKEVIADLREDLSEKYHRKAGARLILLELRERHDLKDLGYFVPQSASTINNILKEMGYIQAPKPKYREPVMLPAPHEEWELDFGEIRLDEDTKLEFLLVVDRGTSRVVYLEGSEGYNAESALEAVARLFVLHGLPQRLRFDRDPRLVGSWTGDSFASALVRFLRVVGVQEVICPPRRPDLKPFVERCIGELKAEWLARFGLETYADAIEVLPDFPHYHNATRPHFGRACQGQIPDEAFPSLPILPELPEMVDPDAWLWADHQRLFRRRITSNGTVQIDKDTYYIDHRRAKTDVLIYLDAQQQRFRVIQDDEVIVNLDIKGLHRAPMDFQSYLVKMKHEARSIEMHRFMTWYRIGDVT